MKKSIFKFSVLLILGLVLPAFFVADFSGHSVLKMNDAMAATKLGDLSKFKIIALDVQALVTQQKLAEAKKRIKDLESKWDEAEAGIKPRAGSDWRQLDKKIDSALDALRENNPDQKKCLTAINELIQTFNQLEK